MAQSIWDSEDHTYTNTRCLCVRTWPAATRDVRIPRATASSGTKRNTGVCAIAKWKDRYEFVRAFDLEDLHKDARVDANAWGPTI